MNAFQAFIDLSSLSFSHHTTPHLSLSVHVVFRTLKCAQLCALSNNKNVRLSVATAVLNTSSYIHASSSPSTSEAECILDVVGTILTCGKYESEPIVRTLMALGTVLLLPGSCGMEAKGLAKGRSLGSTAERVASEHGELAKSVAKEILSIL